MPFLQVGIENDHPIKLYYEDQGAGRPVVLIHGFPFDVGAWERQKKVLLDAGYRTILYDRRGFGKSSQPITGYNYDTFAADLDVLLNELDIQDATLVGHSMGTGEVTRYIGTYGSDRVLSAVLISPLQPFLLKTDDNPEGVDKSVFEGIKTAIANDRYAFYTGFLDDFFNLDENLGKLVSQEAVTNSWNIATHSSPIATYACVDQWGTDFREDVKKNDVPTLVIHGDKDRVLPYDVTAGRLPELIADVKVVTLKGAPHGIPWTHAEDVNRELLEFLQ